MTCSHRRIRRLIDVQRPDVPVYQLICGECMVRTQPLCTGLSAWRTWLHERQTEQEWYKWQRRFEHEVR